MISIQQDDFDVSEITQALRKSSNNIGAIVSFCGLVREFGKDSNIRAMSLEHYPGMTEKVLGKIVDEATRRWQLIDSAVIHRVGRLSAGDNIVLVATASQHRKDAFEAAQFIMDFLKSDAPFWKKEHSDDGSYWVEAKTSDQEEKHRW